MLGDNVKMSRTEFNPYLPDHKDGYYELDQIKPGVVLCPFCNDIIDATQNKHVRATVEAIGVFDESSWASVPVCSCPGVWAVYEPNSKKWSFRYRKNEGSNEWQNQ